MMTLINYEDSKVKNNYVEIYGMPASGKTSLVQKMMEDNELIVDINKELPKPALSRQVYKIKGIFSYFLSSPVMFINDFIIILLSRQKSIKDLLIVSSNWFLILYMYRKNKYDEKNIIMWDQGLFQALWSINFSSRKKLNMTSLLKNKILPKIVYFIDAEDYVLIDRALNRGTFIRLDYNNKNQIIKARESLSLVFEQMKNVGYSTM